MNRIDAKGMTLKELHDLLRQKSGEDVIILNTSHINGIGAGFSSGKYLIEGDAGDFLGMLNDGATFEVNGNCGRFLADGMTRGTVIVRGNAGEGAAEYCYGGTVLVQGDAGDFLATMNKGATVIVTGNVGDDIGTYMVNGKVIIIGEAGKRLGNCIIGGEIFCLGDYLSLGKNAMEQRLMAEDVDALSSLSSEIGVQFNPREFKKIIPCSSSPFYGDKKKMRGT